MKKLTLSLSLLMILVAQAQAQTYDMDAQAYFNRAGSLSGARKNTINTFIVNLKDSLNITTLSDTFDGMWLLGNETETSAQKNIVADSNHITLGGSPVFVSDSGYTVSSGNYLNTNLKASAAANMQQNSYSLGLWSRSETVSTGIDMGMRISGPSQRTELKIRETDNRFYYRMSAHNSSGVETSSSKGLFVITRTGASATSGYQNAGSPNVSGTQVSAALPSLNIYVGAVNDGTGVTPNGSAVLPTNREYAFAFVGGKFDAVGIRKIYNCVNEYLITPIATGNEVDPNAQIGRFGGFGRWLGW